MAEKADYPILFFASQAHLEAWLAEHHGETQGIWMKLAKKDSGIASVSYLQAVESALCFGWIDGQSKSLDEQYWLQKFTPRRARSKWSKINCERAAALIESGRMRPAGLRQVEQAKADGRWEAAYDSPSQLVAPPDLQRELDKYPAAQEFFNSLNSRNRYAILYQIQDAKKPETRAARIQKFVEMLKKGQKPVP